MIKAIVFDYGGVVSDGGAGNTIAADLASALSVDQALMQAAFRQAWARFVRGKVDEPRFWQMIEQSIGRPIPDAQRLIWSGWDAMKPRPEMIAFISALRANGHTVGLVSNTVPFTAGAIQERNGYALFAPCILSYEVGYAKPDIEIYQLLLQQLPDTKPHEILYVDDLEVCLAPAKQLGMHTILATSTRQIIDDVAELLPG